MCVGLEMPRLASLELVSILPKHPELDFLLMCMEQKLPRLISQDRLLIFLECPELD